MQEKKNLPVEESGKTPTVSQTTPQNEELNDETMEKVTGGHVDHATYDYSKNTKGIGLGF